MADQTPPDAAPNRTAGYRFRKALDQKGLLTNDGRPKGGFDSDPGEIRHESRVHSAQKGDIRLYTPAENDARYQGKSPDTKQMNSPLAPMAKPAVSKVAAASKPVVSRSVRSRR